MSADPSKPKPIGVPTCVEIAVMIAETLGSNAPGKTRYHAARTLAAGLMVRLAQEEKELKSP
jgi:hypothetical protein